MVERTTYFAKCSDCVFDVPFLSEERRDAWAETHREIGHTVRVGYHRVRREAVIIEHDPTPGSSAERAADS